MMMLRLRFRFVVMRLMRVVEMRKCSARGCAAAGCYRRPRPRPGGDAVPPGCLGVAGGVRSRVVDVVFACSDRLDKTSAQSQHGRAAQHRASVPPRLDRRGHYRAAPSSGHPPN